MKNNFVHREKQKRLEHACGLWRKGKALHEIAKSLDVSEDTVKRYLEEAQHKETKGGRETSLNSFTAKTTTLNSLFASSLAEGFKCARCKRYAKREAGILWREDVFLCRVCYLGLTQEEIEKFR